MLGYNHNFFTDLHGLQLLNNLKTTKPIQHPGKYKLERLYNYFKFHTNPTDIGLECIILMELIKNSFRDYLIGFLSATKTTTEDEEQINVEDFVEMCLIQTIVDRMVIKNDLPNGILRKLPQKIVGKILELLDVVVDRIPTDFFKTTNSDNIKINKQITRNEDVQIVDKMFFIPMNPNAPEVDDENNDNNEQFAIQLQQQFNIAANNTYNIVKSYEKYKSKLQEFPFNEFKNIIINCLNSEVTKTNEELLNDLLDMFGCEVFEFLNEIIQNRYSIINWDDNETASNNKLQQQQTIRRNEQKLGNQERAPALASQVIVQSEEEKNYAKALRKIEKKQKNNKLLQQLPENGQLITDMEDDLDYLRHKPIFQKGLNIVDYPHVHDQLRNHAIVTKFNGMSFKQPENTIKKDTSAYTEFTIPGGTKESTQNNIELIKIENLDSIGQIVFKDIKQLNLIQSEVYPIAYNTNENMLICAPTGSGKTNIALLAIVNTIKQYMCGNLINKEQFKIVYICPMKALATEMVQTFTKKLTKTLNINVREVTGDIQLTKKEMSETQILVTTPEKWDVITRKGSVDLEIINLVKLLIIDEIHLLNSERGSVIEALVARTLRQVLSNQNIIRIIGLSATLPGYLDVANFLKINLKNGLYFFDNRYRSVPLTMSFIGMKNKNDLDGMDIICYNKVLQFIQDGHQAMIFVTSRNLTGQVAKNLLEYAKGRGHLMNFVPEKSVHSMKNFKSSELHLLVPNGFGIHHAGLCRSDRLEIESLFRLGYLKVIVCTTTLAWGVNLPAHAVIIRGTTRYDAQKSTYVDMDMLDIMQIFGRAGRPQYDTSGHGIIITNMQQMINYMQLLTSQTPIESQFLNYLPDNLNAEIVLGTVSNLKEAMEWLTNTFLYCRIKKNPLVYGLTFTDVWDQEKLFQFLERKLNDAAVLLDEAKMIRFNKIQGELNSTNYGRIASFYYITYNTMKYFHDNFKSTYYTNESNILYLLCHASEFNNIQIRNDELMELERLENLYSEFDLDIDKTSVIYKILVLIQTNISRGRINLSSLISDSEFIIQTVQRLIRALFEISIDFNYSQLVSKCLLIAQMIEQQTWVNTHPLLQFKELQLNHLNLDLITLDELETLSEFELNFLLKNNKHLIKRLKYYCKLLPRVELDLNIKPITDGVIRIQIFIKPLFQWDMNIHGNVQHFYIWIEDREYDSIYHFESFIITKRLVVSNESVELVFTIPLNQPHSNEYYVVVANSKYMFTEISEKIDLEKLNLFPSTSKIQTKFLCVRPLPKTVLKNKSYEKLYNFDYFNSIQSQIFHTCYNTNLNILLGAPTGSGKTIVSEICILRIFNLNPKQKIIYIAPMKALVHERLKDWKEKFENGLNKKIIEITGDIQPNSKLLNLSNIIITTPEKWDSLSRNWLNKTFVKNVGLIIIDEIHLLGEERGPVLEIIVSRMNFINSLIDLNNKVRIVGLSTAMANAGDLANWLGIEKRGLYNFSSQVRPVPLEIHLKGFQGKNYCPRMATMNKPAYQAINQYSEHSSTLIFVSSRKQTRITSYDLIKYLLNDTNPKQWLKNITDDELNEIRLKIIDTDLNYLISFGIGIHHAGLQETDRYLVEELFLKQTIQILVTTTTLAWGVNLPAHLVIIKGTEYYNGQLKRYIDMPITDILQMIGRAGRPQFDTNGIACVFVQETKKNFYRKFLFEPFPVESNLIQVLPEHVNAEIVNNTITCKIQLIDFICSTFFFRRLLINPTYYKMNNIDNVNDYLSDLTDSVCGQLVNYQCIIIKYEEENNQQFYEATYLGELSAQYYLSCKTVLYLNENLLEESSFDDLLLNVCQVEEYALFPVRHNEDKINKHLINDLNIKTKLSIDSPHLKVLLLIKLYLINKKMPNQEYVIDLKTVFDQIIRIIQAMISLTSYKSWLDTTLKLIYLNQMLIQGFLITNNHLLIFTNFNEELAINLQNKLIQFNLLSSSSANNNQQLLTILLIYKNNRQKFLTILTELFNNNKQRIDECCKILHKLPIITINWKSSINGKIVDKVGNNEIILNSSNINNNLLLFEFNIKRNCISQNNTNNLQVFTKKFSKQKDESWFFILVAMNSNELVRLQRFTIKKFKTLDCQLEIPSIRGTYNYSAYFMSDSYIGLDQKIHFKIKVE